jgi:hypothetical protein
VNHPGSVKSPAFTNSVMGLKEKYFGNPGKWPTVILK